MVCVGDWQIQIIFTQMNQYSCTEFSYASSDVSCALRALL